MSRRLAATLLVLLCGCSSNGATPSTVNDAAVDATGLFGSSPCEECVTSACSTAVTQCESAPDCASYLSCIESCPVGSDGNVDPTCAAACPSATSSAGQQAQSSLASCRASGAGAACSACGIDAGNADADADAAPALLHENCMPDYDAANGCAQCLREQCCQARLGCLNDTNCAALANCESDCNAGLPDDAGATATPPDGGGYACDLWCNAQSNPSLAKWAQLITCGTDLCQGASQCGGGDTCTMCLVQHCASEDVALSATADGYLYNECIGACPTTSMTCQAMCLSQYPGVASALTPFDTCIQQFCSVCVN